MKRPVASMRLFHVLVGVDATMTSQFLGMPAIRPFAASTKARGLKAPSEMLLPCTSRFQADDLDCIALMQQASSMAQINPQQLLAGSDRLVRLAKTWEGSWKHPMRHGWPQHRAMMPEMTVATASSEQEMLPVYRERAIVLPPPSPRLVKFPVDSLLGRRSAMLEQQELHAPSSAKVDVESASDTIIFVLWLTATMCFAALLLSVFKSRKRVVLDEDDPEHEMERGRPCWNVSCPLAGVLLCLVVFKMTLLQVAVQNDATNLQPIQNETLAGHTMTVYQYPITNPGLRAFMASVGVMLSLAVAFITLLNWRHADQVKVTLALLAKVMLRGATLSLMLAMALELAGQALLSDVGLSNRNSVSLGTFLVMLVVGFSEELAKLAAVACGSRLSVAALAVPDTGCSSICSAWCRALLADRRSLALAGLAAGFGFMTVENAGYLMASASMPPKFYQEKGEHGKDVPSAQDMDGGAVTFVTAITICVRVLLNIHPWLSGVSAIRAGNRAFGDGAPTVCSGLLDMIKAVWPSALIHCAYDFALVAGPGILGIFLPFVFWYGSRRHFSDSWPADDGAEAATRDPHDPAPAPTQPSASEPVHDAVGQPVGTS